MYKSVIIIYLLSFISLAGCGKNKLPNECQEALNILEQIDTEASINPYVTSDLKKSTKKAVKLWIMSVKKSRMNNPCNGDANIYREALKALKNTKSEEDASKILQWTKIADRAEKGFF